MFKNIVKCKADGYNPKHKFSDGFRLLFSVKVLLNNVFVG